MARRRKSPDELARAKWAAAVRRRDKYSCQACGRKTTLQVHHVLPVSLFPVKKLETSNGITLCRFHHTELHRAKLELILAPVIWSSKLAPYKALQEASEFKKLSVMPVRRLPAHELLRVVVRNPQKVICELHPTWAKNVLGLEL